MIHPRRLSPGDRIALVAPASGFKPAELEAGVRELARLGFEAVYDEAIFERTWFEAGPPDVRARILRQAWRDPSIAALLAVRGGYGSQQLLPLLEPEEMKAAAKLLIGYSDITALLCWSCAHGVVSLHGPMVEGRLASGPAAYDEATFLRAAMVAEPLGELAPPSLEAFAPGEASGIVVGGTLSQIVSLLGTPWAFEVPRGAILFLEDVGERPYRIHRMLTQLAQSGMLARAGALVFGEFPRCDEPGGDPAIRDVLREFTRGFPGPVLFGFPSGHTSGPTWTLPIGVRGRVRATLPAVIIDEAAVS
ncbi:MAG: LD-carboxypeptidase [Acidobacteria bacterium]|nr:LD-carboxypeptidase [Acidobacteriota bacterium]